MSNGLDLTSFSPINPPTTSRYIHIRNQPTNQLWNPSLENGCGRPKDALSHISTKIDGTDDSTTSKMIKEDKNFIFPDKIQRKSTK